MPGWGYNASAVAFGDVDGDGRDEIGIARHSGENERIFVLDDRLASYRLLFSAGKTWGYPATGIAFGDLDGDGRDEMAVSRRADENWGFAIYEDAQANFKVLHTGANTLKSLGVAIGNVDGDEESELLVSFAARRNCVGNTCFSPSKYEKFAVFDGKSGEFRELYKGGEYWGYLVSDLAFGDIDGDGLDEIAIGRKAVENARFLIFDDARRNFSLLASGGTDWGYPASAVAFGDIAGSKAAEFAVGRNSGEGVRYLVYALAQ